MARIFRFFLAPSIRRLLFWLRRWPRANDISSFPVCPSVQGYGGSVLSTGKWKDIWALVCGNWVVRGVFSSGAGETYPRTYFFPTFIPCMTMISRVNAMTSPNSFGIRIGSQSVIALKVILPRRQSRTTSYLLKRFFLLGSVSPHRPSVLAWAALSRGLSPFSLCC